MNNPRARPKHRAAVQHKVTEILRGERGPELIRVTITDQGTGRFDLTWELDRVTCLRVVEEVYGKKILITSQEAWSEVDIIAAYCGQSHIERVFKHLKHPHHHAVQPQYHWTDQKIAVHTFICY